MLSSNKKIRTYQGLVFQWECDHMQHMNVQYYISKYDQATWSLFHTMGLTPSFLKENKRGMVAVEQNVKYLSELVAGDCVYIETELLEVRDKVLKFKHVMYKQEFDTISSECIVTGVHIDSEIRKSTPMPDFIKRM